MSPRSVALILVVNALLSIYAHWILALQGWWMLAAFVVQFFFGLLVGIEIARWERKKF